MKGDRAKQIYSTITDGLFCDMLPPRMGNQQHLCAVFLVAGFFFFFYSMRPYSFTLVEGAVKSSVGSLTLDHGNQTQYKTQLNPLTFCV